MKIYWIFLVLSLITYVWCQNSYEVVKQGNHYEPRALLKQAIPFFAVVIFFCGLRSGIADTGTYIRMFNEYPSTVGGIDWSAVDKDRGFYLLSVLYKQFISTDFHGWLFVIALISGVTFMLALKKYSAFFGFSCYLFIATTTFTYLVNGMRQFIVVSVFFWLGTNYILERRFWRYFILIAILSTIHGSAWLLLLVYFLVKVRPWGMTMWSVLFLSMLAGVFFSRLLPFLGNILDDTQYSGYVGYISSSGVGSNVLRLVIAAIPCIISYLAKDVIKEQENELINFAINMSLLNLCLFFVATFSSGMVVGRVTVYFDVFNLILLPWLLKYVFTEKSSKLITLACLGIYVIYFWFQMTVAWSMIYESDILHLYL